MGNAVSDGRDLRSPGHLRPDVITISAALLLTAWVQRNALSAFFSLDDLFYLEQAVGIIPTLPSPHRFLSQTLYFRIMVGLFGPNPLPYHFVTYITHLTNVALFFSLLRLWTLPRTAAGLAAALFGTMPLSLTLLSSAIGINDELAMCLTLIALIAVRVTGAYPTVTASAAFTLALFCKESVIFLSMLPVVVRASDQTLRSGLRRALPLLVISLVVGMLFFILRHYGLAPDSRAYAMRPGMNVFHNLTTYISWVTNLVHPMPDLVSSYHTTAWPWALVVTLALGLVWRFLSEARPGIGLGAAWWLLGLLPVLPLRFQTFRHYLYPALPGMALAVATALTGLVEWASERWTGSRARRATTRAVVTIALAACSVAYAGQADRLISARLHARLPGVDLSPDPVIRRREVAGRALSSIARSLNADTRLVALFAPSGTERVFGARSGREYRSIPTRRKAYDLLAESLDQGQAIRLFFPQVDSVAFISSWSPRYRDYDLFMRYENGDLLGVGRGPRAHEQAAEWMLGQGWTVQTGRHLEEVLAAYPTSERLRLFHARALQATGDRAREAHERSELIRQVPGDSLGLHGRSPLRADR